MKNLKKCYYMFKHFGFIYTIMFILSHLHLENNFFNNIMFNKEYTYYKNLPPEKYRNELELWYNAATGKNLNLDNPLTYNEKIQWLKLYDSTPIKTQLADKYLVRNWIKGKIGEEYLVPLLGVWSNFDEIDFNKLPDQFVLKANHGSGWNIIVKDKKKFNKLNAKRKFDLWLKKNYAFQSGLELHYLNIQPKIIAEKYLDEIDRVYDYKFMCFNGEVKFLWVDSDRYKNHKRTLFNTKWEKLKIEYGVGIADYEIAKPKNFDKMLYFSELLSKGFAFVRVDFYEINNKLYFGEMTFTSGSGITEPKPYKYTYVWGDMLKLPEKQPIPVKLNFSKF